MLHLVRDCLAGETPIGSAVCRGTELGGVLSTIVMFLMFMHIKYDCFALSLYAFPVPV